MLNYTSKIQHFLNLHRKHTKYIVVLLLLSAFVASFVCSALTEPAVSMTDPIQMGQNVTLLADGDQSDGLPVLGYHYADNNSQFKEYIYWNADWESNIRQEHLLGSAHNFGMFAFDTINVGSSCNSNLAAPNLELGHTFGLGSIADNGGQEITVATNSVKLNSSLTSRNTVLLFPENVKFIDEQGKPVNINPLPRVQIGGNHLEKGNSAVYAYHVTSNFINFGEEQGKFKQLQQKLIHETSGTVSIQNYQDNKIEKVTVSTEGINYLTIPYTDLPDGSRAINFEIENNAALIINVDLKDAPSDYKTGFQVNGKVNGLDFQKDDKASINGVNILWNFYDSSQTEKQYSGSITFDNPGYGCILAPSATVTLSATYAGNIVANNINAGATVNKAMFMTGVEATSSFIALMAAKEWNDGNENHSSDYVTFQLYKSIVANANVNDLTETVGDPVEVRATDNWNCTWFNLDQSYCYYVKEVASGTIGGNPFICDTEYTNNGGNQTGTITVKNKKVDSSNIDTSAKLDLTIKLYWSDNAEAHEMYKDESDNTEYKRKWVNIYRTTDPSQIGTMNDAHKVVEEHIYDSGVFVTERADKNGEDGQAWQRVIKNLPVTDSNKNIYYYYAQIVNGSNNYYFNYSNNNISRNNGTITVACIKKLTITVKKSWNWGTQDPENVSSVRYELYRSMKEQQTIPSDAVKITEFDTKIESSNGWTQSIYPLPQSDVNCNMYYYYIKETHVNDNESELSKYNVSYAYDDELYSYPFNDHGEMTITNERKQAGNVSIKVAKRMTVLHGTSKAVLYYSNDYGANWTKLSEQTLSEANNWQCTFINLSRYENSDQNKPRSYRVLEENTPYGFNASYSGNDVLAYNSADNTIHNVYINNNEKKVSLNIQKFWENINDDIIDYVKIKVYQVKSTDYQMVQTLLLNNSLTFNSYINMLNGSSNPTINGNTVTYSNLSFTEAADKTNYNYEIRIDLSQFAGNTLDTIKVNNSSGGYIGWIQETNNANHLYYVMNSSQTIKRGEVWQSEVAVGCQTSIDENYTLIISSYKEVDYYISSLELTFQNAITTGTTTQPAVTTTTTTTTTTTITTQGGNTNNTVVLTNPGYDENGAYSACKYNYYFNLSSYEGRQITKLEFKFNTYPGFENLDNSNGNHYILIGSQSGIVNNNNLMLIKTEQDFYQCYNNNAYSGCTYDKNNNILTYQVGTNGDNYQSLRSISNGDYLVFTVGRNNKEDFTIESLTITFADSGGNVIHESGTFTATPSTDYTYKIVDKFSAYSGKLVTEIKSYYYSKANDAHDYQSGYNLYAGNDGNGYIPSDSSKSSWNEYIQTQGYNNENLTQVTFKAKYPDNLQKIIVTYSDGSTFTLNNTAWNNKIHYSDSIQFNSASGNGTDKMSGSDNAYNILSKFSNYEGKTVASIHTYFYGLDSNGKNNSTLHDHTFNAWARGNINGETGGYIDDSSPNNNWNGDARVKEYTEENGKNITGFSVQTRYANNVEKVVVNYTDGSTFILYNSNYNGQLDTIVIPSSAVHQTTEIAFPSGSQDITLPDVYVSKEVDYVEMYFKNNLSSFPDGNYESTWFKNSSWNDVGNHSSTTFSNNIAKWDYSNCTNGSYLGLKTVNNTEVQKVVITYTDGSTYTVGNSNYNIVITTTEQTQQTKTLVTSTAMQAAGLFDNGHMNTDNDNIYNIPDEFKTMVVDRIEATFYYNSELTPSGKNDYDTVFNMFIEAGYENGYPEDYGSGKSGWKGNVQTKYYKDDFKINTITVRTAYPQNLEKVEIYFRDESESERIIGHITIYNTVYNNGQDIVTGLVTSTTTTTPSNGFITEITLTETNNWSATLNDLPMVAPDGTPYYYFIVEVEIGVKSEYQSEYGTTYPLNKFDITYSPAYLELSENSQENILAVTNSLKLTNVNMPSTGGIGTHPYRNAGILMMICSGGIYVSLRALRKKQN